MERFIRPENIDLKLGALEADGEILIPLSAVRAAIAAAPSEDVVKLPCKVGDPVYVITNEDMLDVAPVVCEIWEDEIYEIGCGRSASGEIRWSFYVAEVGEEYPISAFGKCVFRTAAEAEKVLAERMAKHEKG